MAAAVVSLREYLRNIIGLSGDAVGLDHANAIIDEGINSAEDLADLYDNEGIKLLCANMRKPGGTMPDPAHAGGGVVPQIPRTGHSIPTACENRLNLAAYEQRYTCRLKGMLTLLICLEQGSISSRKTWIWLKTIMNPRN